MKCVDEHPEILKVFEKLLEERNLLAPSPTPWRIATLDPLPFSNNSFLSCTKLNEEACDPFGSLQIAFGIAPVEGSTVSLVPITDVIADDQAKEIILKTCPNYADMHQPPIILTVSKLESRFASLLAGREDFRV